MLPNFYNKCQRNTLKDIKNADFEYNSYKKDQ